MGPNAAREGAAYHETGVRVLERHPEPMGLAGDGYPLPGWCWLETPMKVLSVAEHLLEFTDKQPSVTGNRPP
jgi:hypothetical protein